jgi:glyoxylase-like metal-dependent hydrolase (beta-lactamase superfamily II)
MAIASRRARTGWDDGALSLGIANYAVVADGEALVYDTHVSVEHARYVREVLEEEGVSKFTVVLSHWHLDHGRRHRRLP